MNPPQREIAHQDTSNGLNVDSECKWKKREKPVHRTLFLSQRQTLCNLFFFQEQSENRPFVTFLATPLLTFCLTRALSFVVTNLFFWLISTHARAHTHTHTHTHNNNKKRARAHTHTLHARTSLQGWHKHTHTHTCVCVCACVRVCVLSLIHIWRCRRITGCRSRWSPDH